MSEPTASTSYIKQCTIEEAESKMYSDLKRLVENCPENDHSKYWEQFMGFLNLFRNFLKSKETLIPWNEIEHLPKESLLQYNDFPNPDKNNVRKLLNKLIIIKLNGGLGTRMRCDGPKSLIPVRSGLSFLDLTVQQIVKLNTDYDINVPLVLMNSYNTSDSTSNAIKKYKDLRIKIHTFTQNKYPRITFRGHFQPLPEAYNDAEESRWYPPGHGDFFETFNNSGLLQDFMNEGKEFCFLSNIDNLGATVDFGILNFLVNPTINPPPEFLMEVTDKTPADLKGGTLIYVKGQLKLLEYLQVPVEHEDEFKGGWKFKMFNTNNLWMNLKSVSKLVSDDKVSLDIICNKKKISRGDNSIDVIQLERAVGAAVGLFPSAVSVVVPRSRFLPAKTTSDLFLLRSNVYACENGSMCMNPLRRYPSAPFVRLTDDEFGSYKDIDRRFAQMPDCLELQHLMVCGDVCFGKDITFDGNVAIIANQGRKLDIPQGCVLQSKIITGYLKTVDF